MKKSHPKQSVLSFLQQHAVWITVGSVFALFLFLRLYQFEAINPFGWDQLDNAWAAKGIIVDHHLPLNGMEAKGTSGIFIGPYYYYFVALIYLFTNLDPVASLIIAMITAVISFWALYYVVLKLFSRQTALFSVFIYAVSFYAIIFDRVQWPVNFIMPVSLLIFYALYKIMLGEEKYLLLLASAVGFAFHIHFTAVFYPLIVLLCLPFFPRTKKTVLYSLYGIGIFAVFFWPILLMTILNHSASQSLDTFLALNYHGFHLVRFFQVAHDAFIKFDSIFQWGSAISWLRFFFVPLFLLLLYQTAKRRQSFVIGYLTITWFLIPWLVFTVYKGEISDYYFSLTLPLVYMILGYFSEQLFSQKFIVLKMLVLLFWAYFAYMNIAEILPYTDGGSLQVRRQNVEQAIQEDRPIQYGVGNPEAYLYYLYLRRTQQNDKLKSYFETHE